MDTFFNRKTNTKDYLLERSSYQKSQLMSQLNLCSKEIHYNFIETNESKLNITETSLSLCSIVEAIFLHGLKNSILRKTINVITGGDEEKRPDINFYPPLLIISHKYIIEKIRELSQITTDIGNCRAWIRISLNDRLLSSYLKTVRKSPSTINSYYYSWSFLRDVDCLEYTEKLIEALESVIVFDLPPNSSLLNIWNDWPLEMSGVWFAPLKNHPITSGIDIASSLSEPNILEEVIPGDVEIDIAQEETEEPKQYNYELTPDPDKGILNDFIPFPDQETKEINEEFCMNNSSSMGNSITSKIGWSSHETNDEETKSLHSNRNPASRSNSMNISINSPIDRNSFNTLIEKHDINNSFNKNKSLATFNDIWERFESALQVDIDHNSTIKSLLPSEKDLDNLASNEIINEFNEKYSIDELRMFVEQTCKIAREIGLDAQGYICKSCASPLGFGFVKTVQACAFTGNYFCDSCMSPDLFIIPARVIYNWDFKKYPVSLHSASFLTDFENKPFIDLKLVNPSIFNYVTEMSELQTLRIQLNFIRAYLFTCCEKIIKKLQEIIDGREYYHEHVYRYSINDLNIIQKGKLYQLLEKTVNFGRDHILECPLCSQKGFICEICDSPKVLYPFDVTTTYRCNLCGAIFHTKCLDELKPCPKCDRRKKRQDLPLLEIGNESNE